MTLNRITDKNDIVTDVYSKEFVGTGRKNLSFQHMIDIVNKLEWNYHKCQLNGTIREENYKRNIFLNLLQNSSFA